MGLRAILVVLALGAAGVLLFGLGPWEPGRFWVPLTVRIVALLSSLLAAYLAARGDVSVPGIFSLSLGLAALSWAAALLFLGGPDLPAGRLVAGAAAYNATVLLGAAGLMRFFLLFPKPVPAGALAPHVGGRTAERTARVLAGLQSAATWRRVGVACLLQAAAVASPLLLGRPGWAEAMALGLASILTAFALAGGIPMAWVVLEGSFRSLEPDERRRLLWIRWGFNAGVVLFLASGAAFSLGALGLTAPWVLTLAVVLLFLPIPTFLAGLFMAVFHAGALDPRLALRWTALYGVFTAVAVFGFALLETALSDLLMERVGLPVDAGGWIAGGPVALGLQPLHTRLQRRVDRWINERE